MNKKIFLSLVASLVVLGTEANAFGMSGSHSGESNGNGGNVNYGFNQNGGYICVNGFTWMGEGSFQMSMNNAEGLSFGSASGCDDDDFDFYYKTFGGFIQDTGDVSSLNFKPGQDDTYDDGFWYREGKFSSSVYYGDPENDGKRYADDPNGAWPAWTWGRPEADPFVSANGPGDDLGGAAGIGLGGFGMGDGNKIKVDDNTTFYPLDFSQVNNFKNSSFGSYASDVSWNVAIYDKDHNEVFKKNYTTTMYYWETINFQKESLGIVCPRSSVDAGEVVNDLAYNQGIHDNITPYWPVNGFDVDFVSDGISDASACADAVKLKDTNMTDTFTVEKSFKGNQYGHGYGYGQKHTFGLEKKYELSFDGPYIYDATKEGCPATTEEGLPDTAEKWPAECFTKVDTLWSDEKGKTQAFMRMSITEIKDDKCHTKMPNMYRHREMKKLDLKSKIKLNIDSMMQKCNTTLEKAQKAAEGCDFSGIEG